MKHMMCSSPSAQRYNLSKN